MASSTSYIYNETMVLALSDETTALTTGVSKITFRAPYAMNLYQVPRISVNTVSTSGAIIVDIKQAGLSIIGNDKLTIDVNTKTSVTSVVRPTITTNYIPDDTEITLDVLASGTGAKGLKVVIYYRRT